jgi:hypothetical protein
MMRSGVTAAKKQLMTVVRGLGRVRWGECGAQARKHPVPKLRGHFAPFFIYINFFIDTWDFLGYTPSV